MSIAIVVSSDHTEPAFVTHIRSPCHFVVQLNRNIDRLTELSHAINTHCKTSTGKNDVPSRVDPGTETSAASLLLLLLNNSKNSLVSEKLPKTVYCKLHICVHTGI